VRRDFSNIQGRCTPVLYVRRKATQKDHVESVSAGIAAFGLYYSAVSPGQPATESGGSSGIVPSGVYQPVVVSGQPATESGGSAGIASSGLYFLAVYSGAAHVEPGGSSGITPYGLYEQVVFAAEFTEHQQTAGMYPSGSYTVA
jgi:hypothetical protein